MAYQVGMQEDSIVRKGPWLEEEDKRLATFVTVMGERRWDSIARVSGLRRSGKSCRLRWLNYLRPDLKRGRMTTEEERTILQLQEQWGNKWSKIARSLPGRTDNEIKNYWRTHLRKKVQEQKQEVSQEERTNAASTSTRSNEKTKFEHHDVLDIEDTSKDSVDGVHELRNNALLASSPYEISLLDWISSSNQTSPKQQQAQNCFFGSSSTDAEIMLNYCPGSPWEI
ncbi:hypothetical protein Syun_016341 [Stephania yunnanensis]|uniref:Uncharacterized protein n=1 Tax=Stephania yunnanensis TaxID=152371 RepID=A0AAP0J4V1_9MAGN